MDFYAVVNARRSVREYSDRPVPDDALLRILDAARIAPSAANRQPWHWYVIRDPQLRRELFGTDRQAWVAAAPVIVVACSIPRDTWVRSLDNKCSPELDVAIAMDHLTLAATAEGLGSCWLCGFDPAHIRRVLALPPEQEPVAATPLGYAVGDPRPRVRKALNDILTWR